MTPAGAGSVPTLAGKLGVREGEAVTLVGSPRGWRIEGFPDITDEAVRGVSLPLGLVDVKVAALDTNWSGLKLVWRRQLRSSTVS